MSSTTSATSNPGTDDGAQLKYLALITLIIPFGIICFVLYICYNRRQRRSQMLAIKLSGERCVGEPDNENINQALAAGDDDDVENNNKRCTIGNYNPRLVWPNRNMLNGHTTLQEDMVDDANHRREHSDSESTFDPLGHEAQSQQERRARRRLRVLKHDNVVNIVDVKASKLDEQKENNENNARSINLYSPANIDEDGRNVNNTATVTRSNVFNSKFSSNNKCTEATGQYYGQQKVQLKNSNYVNDKYKDVDDNNDYEYDESNDNSENSSDAYGPIYAQSLMQTKGASSSAELLQRLKNNISANKPTPSSANITRANTLNTISSKSNNARITYNEPRNTVQEAFTERAQNGNGFGNSCKVHEESSIPTVRHYDPTMYNATTEVLLNMHQSPIESNNNSAFCVNNANNEIGCENSDINNNNYSNTLVSSSGQKERSSVSSSSKMEIPFAKQKLVARQTSSLVNNMQQNDIHCAPPDGSNAQEVTKLTEEVANHKRTLSDALRRKEDSAFEIILEQASLPPVVPKELHGKSISKTAQQNKSYSNETDSLNTANVNNKSNVNAKQTNEVQSHDVTINANDDDEEGSYEYETADSDDDISSKCNNE